MEDVHFSSWDFTVAVSQCWHLQSLWLARALSGALCREQNWQLRSRFSICKLYNLLHPTPIDAERLQGGCPRLAPHWSSWKKLAPSCSGSVYRRTHYSHWFPDGVAWNFQVGHGGRVGPPRTASPIPPVRASQKNAWSSQGPGV